MENSLQPTSELIPSCQQGQAETGGATAANSEEQAPKTSPPPSRVYECSFCKKGFSNAQALGGHMNIHRKDKAKLKQATSSSNHQRLNRDAQGIVPKNNNNNNPLTPSRTSQVLLIKSSNLPKWQLPAISTSFSSDHHQEDSQQPQAAELKQLPLFVETANTNIQEEAINSAGISWQEEFISGQEYSFGAAHQLDLELRLGHEPPKSTLAMGTRKFF
ncbi:hypothetical protein ACH5RR_020732 [Cinchona calisaya]|uniref:C2H2-type domain-containing protein n=1 Tax=Cinchona calisaya TaxID=153742 RepID=A0ABD2ZFE6_9GENT